MSYNVLSVDNPAHAEWRSPNDVCRAALTGCYRQCKIYFVELLFNVATYETTNGF